MNTKYRLVVIAVITLFIIALAYGIMRYLIFLKEEPPARRSIESTRLVEAKVIAYEKLISPVVEPGRMSSVSEINLSAEASGKIEQGDIQLKEGAVFTEGDILFSIYDDEASLALKAKKSQFLNTLALMLPDIAFDYPDYEEEFRRFFSAIDIAKPLPEFPESRDEKLTIFLSSKNVLSEYYNIRKDELQLSRHSLRAPFSGTFTEVFLEVGAYTNTGGTVATAIRTDALELEVPLNRMDALWVKIGDPVHIESENRDCQWEGRVIRKGQVVDENTQSQRVYVRLSNNWKQPVLAGEYLTATFPGRPVEDVMEIPRNAVFNTNEVFLVKGKRLLKQNVHIVKVNPNTLLFNGLNEGDTLVVQPLINVYEGTKVTTSLDKQEEKKQGPPVARDRKQ